MSKKLPPFLFYFVYFGSASALFPYLALYFQQLGVSGTQLGLLTGLGPLVTLISAPFWTGIADATHRHRLVMTIAFIGTILATVAIPSAKIFWMLLALIIVYSMMGAPLGAFADSATMIMLGDERAMYGRVRLGGTLGWGLAAPIFSTLIGQRDITWSFYIFATGLFITMLISQMLIFDKVPNTTSMRSGIYTLLTNRHWIFFLTMVFMGGIGVATVNSYLFVYLNEIGASKTLMGITLTVSTLSELPVMFFGDRLLKRFKAHGLLVLSVAVVGIRLLLNAAFDVPIIVLLVQLVHGLTFPSIWIAGVSYAHEHAPAGMTATAQGLFGATMMGFGAAAGGFIGGLLIQNFSARMMYVTMGGIILVCLVLIQLLERTFAPEPA